MGQQGFIRYPTIHAETVVFSSEDDLWTVEAAGGVARRLTSGLGSAAWPRLSPDGTRVAFTATDPGSAEVFVLPAQGGEPVQLTFLGSGMTVVTGWSPQGRVEFSAAAETAFRRDSLMWAIDPEGGAPERLSVGPAVGLAYGTRGQRALCRNATDIARWKRYRGGRTGALWVDATGDDDWKLLPSLGGNVAAPMWVGERLFFVSDHEYDGNLYSCLANGSDVRRHTSHRDYFVRFPSSDGRRIVYTCGGDLWVFDPADDTARRVDVDLRSPRTQVRQKVAAADTYLDGWALHPQGHSLAVTVRGKPLVLGNWEGAVVQLGHRHGVRYRDARFLGDDGARVLVISDEGGEEAFEIHAADGSGRLSRIEADIGRAVETAVDPTSRRVAFANHRNEVGVVDLETGEVHMLDHSPHAWCGDVAWSSDGAWLAWYAPSGRRGLTSKIRMARVQDGLVVDVTDGRYADRHPAFDPGGRYLYFLSTREFLPVYDSAYFDLNFTFGMRPYLVTLRDSVPDPFRPVPRPLAAKPPNGAPEPKEPTEAEPVDVDVEGLGNRILGFPVPDDRYDAILGLRDSVLLTTIPVVRGRATDWHADGTPPGRMTLHEFSFDRLELKKRYEAVTGFAVDAGARSIGYQSGARLRVVPARDAPTENGRSGDSNAPSRKSGWVDLRRASVTVDPRAEWAQMLRETWRLMRDQFWTEDMSGVDWADAYARYAPLVARLGCRGEYSELVWEMVGELGTSHAYEMLGDYRRPPNWRIGRLAADLSWDGSSGGYRIDRIVRGEAGDVERSSPLARAGVDVQEGDVIVAIGGAPVGATTTPAALLVDRAGTDVQLTLQRDGASHTVVVPTLNDEFGARYRDWVIANRNRVHRQTDGRIGYVHVPDMGPGGFSEFHRDYLVECGRDGLIVDVRYNGGGHVSQLLLEKLARRVIGYGLPRWGTPYPYPAHTVIGPIVALTNESAGSDGDIFSHAFKLMELGPLVGTRTWGGVVGIWPRFRHADGSLTTQPEFSTWFVDVEWGVENYGTDPDVEVHIAPQDYAAGRDPQLAEALTIVQRLLRDEPPDAPKFDRRPFLGRR